jgi:hypothetical protein
MTECPRLAWSGNAKSGINHENHEHTRKGEKRRAVLGQAKLARKRRWRLDYGTTDYRTTKKQASLPTRLFLNRSSAPLLALLWRSTLASRLPSGYHIHCPFLEILNKIWKN